MIAHKVGTREEWLAGRVALLEEEKELTRRGDELARKRMALPWVKVEKKYGFETEGGKKTLAELFGGRSQLLVYHFMFGPEYTAGCPHCSAIADGFNGNVEHLAHHDVTLMAVSRAPVAKLLAYKKRMGWVFPWASSLGGEFNYDFNVSVTEEQQKANRVEYNYQKKGAVSKQVENDEAKMAESENPGVELAKSVGTDWPTYIRELPGMSAFALEKGVVYHTYSAYARGLDALWGVYQWLDRAPLGRNEEGFWMRRRGEYDDVNEPQMNTN